MLAAHECGLEGMQRSCSIRLDSACHLDRYKSLTLSTRHYMHLAHALYVHHFLCSSTSELSLCSSVDFSQDRHTPACSVTANAASCREYVSRDLFRTKTASIW